MSIEVLRPVFQGEQIRILTIDGEPWFVLSDLLGVLGIARRPSAVAERLDDDVRQTYPIADALGRVQQTNIVSEAGMYDVIVRSDSPAARPFRLWVTRMVLPQIRKTGGYGVAPQLSEEQIVQQALQITSRRVQELEAQTAQLAPKAHAFDGYIGSAGDYSFNEAAKLLQRRGAETGQFKLVATLEEWGWIYRGAKNSPRAKQAQIDTGRLAEKTHYYIDGVTGERVAGRTQVRVTPKGVEDIFTRLTDGMLPAVAR